ncbi:hypothetical protein DFH07DRAFT_763606 [Mycena maculata]|uniref:Uncharacterized protein n=1 Tax=Mycena maculata TaxID=230809 RepID=A0AAD7KGH4_9AGAR|nr:hypothetical protein DFH07DRAFT_763606 [Mycena maculata]
MDISAGTATDPRDIKCDSASASDGEQAAVREGRDGQLAQPPPCSVAQAQLRGSKGGVQASRPRAGRSVLRLDCDVANGPCGTHIHTLMTPIALHHPPAAARVQNAEAGVSQSYARASDEGSIDALSRAGGCGRRTCDRIGPAVAFPKALRGEVIVTVAGDITAQLGPLPAELQMYGGLPLKGGIQDLQRLVSTAKEGYIESDEEGRRPRVDDGRAQWPCISKMRRRSRGDGPREGGLQFGSEGMGKSHGLRRARAAARLHIPTPMIVPRHLDGGSHNHGRAHRAGAAFTSPAPAPLRREQGQAQWRRGCPRSMCYRVPIGPGSAPAICRVGGAMRCGYPLYRPAEDVRAGAAPCHPSTHSNERGAVKFYAPRGIWERKRGAEGVSDPPAIALCHSSPTSMNSGRLACPAPTWVTSSRTRRAGHGFAAAVREWAQGRGPIDTSALVGRSPAVALPVPPRESPTPSSAGGDWGHGEEAERLGTQGGEGRGGHTTSGDIVGTASTDGTHTEPPEYEARLKEQKPAKKPQNLLETMRKIQE